MRPTHYDALAEFLQYNCYALQELNLLGIWINGYKLCEPMKKLRQIRHLAVPFIGCRTSQPRIFQHQASVPDYSTPYFTTMTWLQDISTLDFSTMNSLGIWGSILV